MSNNVLKRGVAVKKPIFIALLTVFILLIAVGASAQQIYYNDEYHYYDAGVIGMEVNGKEVENLPMMPVIINNYTLVPVRELFETLGCEVIWHDDTCSAEIRNNGVSVTVKIGDRNAYAGSEKVVIEEPQPMPMLIGYDSTLLKTMVPVRFIAEKLGYKVEWDNDTRTVLINTNNEDEIFMGTVEPEEEEMPDEENVFGKVFAESDDVYDYIYIGTRTGISPNVTRYPDPDRIVFDFPGALFQSKGNTVNVNGNCVERVRYSNYENTARLVLDISTDTQAVILSSDKGILIRVQKSENDNIVFDTYSKRVYFDKAYVGSGKVVANGYKVTFTNMKLKTQTIEIGDSEMDKIEIVATDTGCTVTVLGSEKITYKAEKGFYMSDKPVVDNETNTDNDGQKIVVIDAGHGGDDPGAVGYNSEGKAVAYESHINLAIALLVGEKLESSGIKVIYTRNSDKYITLKERSDIANDSNCDFFVSIHCNSIAKGDINGTQVYYHPISEKGSELAENIYDNIVDMTGLSPKKTQNGSHLYVIRTTVSPAVLVETAFISNESDRTYLLSKKGQETIAEAIYQGIIETL